MASKVNSKSVLQIGKEWSEIVVQRQKTIENKEDISFLYVTSPVILNQILKESPKNVLDVGCGSGYLTNEISKIVGLCFGIDISDESISIAKQKYSNSNLSFFVSSIEDFESPFQFDLCVSNMVFMTDPNWISSVKKIFSLLVSNGTLLMMITHPCFWPKYWGYQDESWFDYKREIYIENDFSISLVKGIGTTTHIHRPLSEYIRGLTSVGFEIELVDEPYPVCETPPGYDYPYPRFLFIKCRKP